ncbi:MAG TPA: hypothetical protein VKM54_14925 [Myxococcota bacterium]|nr:hypothetical protein [Myxococcota bacterium]
MSKQIAEIRNPKNGITLVYVHASIAGVEIAADPHTTFDPAIAREYAAALLKGADTAESMLAKVQSQPEKHGYPEHTVGDIVGIAKAAGEPVFRCVVHHVDLPGTSPRTRCPMATDGPPMCRIESSR